MILVSVATDADRYRVNWQDEVDSVALYRALAELEEDQRLAEVYRRLAATEERHAGVWEERLRASGVTVPARRPGWRTRLLIAVARRFGTQLVLPTLNDLERADSRGYDNQPESRGTALPAEERSHARLLASLSGSSGVAGSALGRLEGIGAAVEPGRPGEAFFEAEGLRGLYGSVERALRRAGFAVRSAHTGEQALRVLEEEGGRIDLVITDVVMPGMGGRELVWRLQSLYPQIPTILLSGYADREAALEMMEGGQPLFLEKPIDLAELTETVRAILDERRA